MIYYTAVDQFALLPALMLALFGCATLLFDFWVFPEPKHRKWMLLFVVAGLAFAGGGLVKQQIFLAAHGPFTAFQGSLTIDGLSLFFNWIFLVSSLIVVLASHKYLETEHEPRGEYYGLVLLANCGMFFLATGSDLITLFIGLELMALCFYILVGYLRSDKRSNEAAMKYLLLGAFSSGFLVYGFSVLYGIAGSTRLRDVAEAISTRNVTDPLVLLALVTTTVGLLFKISAVPFHMWAPDAYEGAPTTITAYLSVGSKAASFAFLLRMFLVPFASLRVAWTPVLIVIAVPTMTVGNLAAISQTNVKRLLAYSSISHAGYMLLGLIAGNATGIRGIAVYIMVYTFMNLGAFMVIVSLRRQNIIGDEIEDLNGLMQQEPGPRRADADLPDVAGRDSAHGRLPGEVLHFPLADRDRPQRAGGDRGALRGRGGLLLFPDGAGDVRQRGGGQSARCVELRPARGARTDRRDDGAGRHLSRAVPALRPGMVR